MEKIRIKLKDTVEKSLAGYGVAKSLSLETRRISVPPIDIEKLRSLFWEEEEIRQVGIEILGDRKEVL